MQLTEKQSLVLVAGLATGVVISTIAGHAVANDHDRIQAKYNKLAAMTSDLARIASYQARLIDKHIDMNLIDEFDRMVLEDMDKDLGKRLAELQKLEGIMPPEKDGEA